MRTSGLMAATPRLACDVQENFLKIMSLMACTLLCAPVFAQPLSAAAPHIPVPPVAYRSVFTEATSVVSQAQGWKESNDQVGQFRQGHADVLKWEQAQSAYAAQPQPTVAGGGNASSVFDIHKLPMGARKAWINAVAARQSARLQRDALEAAQIGAELAQRMAAVGNWSRLEQVREQLLFAEAAAQLARAEQNAFSAREEFIRQAGLWGPQTDFSVAENLADLPTAAIAIDDIEARALRARQHLQGAAAEAQAVQVRSEAREAYFRYRSAYDLAVYYRDTIVPLRKDIHEEMVLRYSGMLASVWDLLVDTRQQLQAQDSALQAQRDFWLAEADLQCVLSGVLPSRLGATPIPSAAEASISQGH